MKSIPLVELQAVADLAPGGRRGGPWAALAPILARWPKPVVVDRRLALMLLRRRHVPHSEWPDAMLAVERDCYRILLVDPSLVESHLTAEQLYRRDRALWHEFVHILGFERADWAVLAPPSPHATSAHVPVALGPLVDPDNIAPDPLDEAEPLREQLAEQLALVLQAPPRGFVEALRRPGTTDVAVAEDQRISVNDVRRYINLLLMSGDEDLRHVGTDSQELLRFEAYAYSDPRRSLARVLRGQEEARDTPPRWFAPAAFNLETEATHIVMKLLGQAEVQRPLIPTGAIFLPMIVRHYIRRHSGSEIGFMLMKNGVRPFQEIFATVAAISEREFASIAAIMCAKLGCPHDGLALLAQFEGAESEVRLLEARGACELRIGTPDSLERAVRTYDAAARLDGNDPEVRFGLVNSVLKAQGIGAAESLLRALPDRSSSDDHWLEDYLRGWIAFSRWNQSREESCLTQAEAHLRRALGLDESWPGMLNIYELRDRNAVERIYGLTDPIFDADKKKAGNLLARVLVARSKLEGRPELQDLAEVVLLSNWVGHKLDAKTTFCLYRYYLESGRHSAALTRLRELVHLRPMDPAVWEYLERLIRERFADWGWYADCIARLRTLRGWGGSGGVP